MENQVVNPATGRLEREVPTETDAEMSEVLARASGLFVVAAHVKAERADMLRRVARLYRDRSSDLGAIITREMGKTTAEAEGEMRRRRHLPVLRQQGQELLEDSHCPGGRGGKGTEVPVGPVLGIMPWNFPYYQVARFAAPNLMVGNTIILKHAPQCPESALAMEQIFREAGLRLTRTSTSSRPTNSAATIVRPPDMRRVGDRERASRIGGRRTAGKNLKKVVLELGGSDAFIVLDTADLAR